MHSIDPDSKPTSEPSANPPYTPWQRRIVLLCVAGAVLLAIGIIVYAFIGNALIDSIYRGESHPLLNRFVPQPVRHPLEHYQVKGRQLVTRAVILVIGLGLLLLGIAFRGRLGRFLVRFFTEPDHALNLAIFRVIFFTTLLVQVELHRQVILRYSSAPEELRIAPFGIGWILPWLRFDPEVTARVIDVLRVVCVTGMVGLFSRTSALIAALLSCYALGIPQCFGKVNHYHFFVWFSAMLAVSRCGDALSVDRLLQRRWGVPAPGPSSVYGAPLRFIWLLLSVLYFFPGFWKLFESGLDWAFSDNLNNTMHAQWQQLHGWRPFWRIDQYPLLLWGMAFFTIAFELAFVFLIFSRRTRWLAALTALAFHTGTLLFMRIDFLILQAMLLSMFDWHALFVQRTGHPGGDSPKAEQRIPGAVVWVGGTLLAVNVVLGFAYVEKGWPFACGPTFSYMTGPDLTKLEVVVQRHGQPPQTLDERPIAEALGTVHWTVLLRQNSGERDPDLRQRKLDALWRFLTRCDLVPSDVHQVSIYETELYLTGDDAMFIRRTLRTEFGPGAND